MRGSYIECSLICTDAQWSLENCTSRQLCYRLCMQHSTAQLSDSTVKLYCGGVTQVENVAIVSREKGHLRDLMAVSDQRGLTVWTDQDAKWRKFKSDSFLKYCDLGGNKPCEDENEVMQLDSEGVLETQDNGKSFTGTLFSFFLPTSADIWKWQN